MSFLGIFGSLLGLAELLAVLAAFYVVLRKWSYPRAEAYALASVAALCLLSFVFQLFFLLGLPAASLFVEALLLVGSLKVLGGLWSTYGPSPLLPRGLGLRHLSVIAPAFYLAACALLLPPSNGDALRYHLARVLLFQQERSLFLPVPSPHQAHMAVFPVGSDLLAHSSLRWGGDYFVSVPSFLSYLCVVVAAYAVARRGASRESAILASLALASLPVLVYHSTSTKNDIVLAAVGMSCVLLMTRLVERPTAADLGLLVLFTAFGISVKTLFFALAVPIFLVVTWSLRSHLIPMARTRRNRTALLVLLPVVLVLSQGWLFARNYRSFGHWQGPPSFVRDVANRDGLTGAVANVTRYGLQSIDGLKVTDLALRRTVSLNLPAQLTTFYDNYLQPLWGDMGAARPFSVKWSIDESKSWFGPFLVLLWLPAMILCTGNRHRLLVLVALSYSSLVAYLIAWTPWNGRFFAPAVAVSAPCVAALFDRIPQKAVRTVVGAAAILLLWYGCLFNQAKPLLPLTVSPDLLFEQLRRDNIWSATEYGLRRSPSHSGLLHFQETVPSDASVSVIKSDASQIYYYLLARRDLRFGFPPVDGTESVPDENWLLCVDAAERCQLYENTRESGQCFEDGSCLFPPSRRVSARSESTRGRHGHSDQAFSRLSRLAPVPGLPIVRREERDRERAPQL